MNNFYILLIIVAAIIVFDSCIVKPIINHIYFRKESLLYKQTVLENDLIESLNNISQYIEFIIDEAIVEYQAFNPSIFLNKEYLTSEDETIIRDNVVSDVKDKLPTEMIRLMCLYYNKNVIDEVIANKIYLKVTKFVVEYNESNVEE